MNAPTTQLTERAPMPAKWVGRIFAELQGNYGSKFLSMWATGETLPNGSDAGLSIAMQVWGQKLAGFSDKPEAIKAQQLLDDGAPLPLPELEPGARGPRQLPAAVVLLDQMRPTGANPMRGQTTVDLLSDLFVAYGCTLGLDLAAVDHGQADGEVAFSHVRNQLSRLFVLLQRMKYLNGLFIFQFRF